MYYAASLFVAFVLTFLFVSKVAQMLHAKRFGFGWVLLASIVGGIAASAASLLLTVFVEGIDPMVMMVVSLLVMLLVSSAAFKYINTMSWSGAITTNIASIAALLITVTVAVVLNGESLNDTISSVTSTANKNVSAVKSVADGSDIQDVAQQLVAEEDVAEDVEEEAIEEEPVLTELDLLLPSAVNEIKKKKKKVYVEPKYHVTSVGNIHSLVGQPIRIIRSNGSVVAGSLKKISGSDAFVAQRMHSGVATTPVSINKIRKLEVYR